MMRIPRAHVDPRPLLLGLAGLGLAFGIAAIPLTDAVEAARQIADSRERLARAREVAARPLQTLPLVAPDADSLAADFRRRLDILAEDRAAIVDSAMIEPDPNNPSLPRMRASLRGTAEGLHDLLHALETQTPLVAVEDAELGIERSADPETGRPGVMRANLTARGVLLPPAPATQAGTR